MKKTIISILFAVIPLSASSNQCLDLFPQESAKVDWRNVPAIVEEAKNLFEVARQGCKFGVGFCIRLPGHALFIAKRVYTYEASIDSIREEIILPLARHISDVRSSELNGADRARTMENFVMFFPELILKIQKSIPQLATRVSFNAVTGMMSTSQSAENTGIIKDLVIRILKKSAMGFRDMDFTKPLMPQLQKTVLSATEGVADSLLHDLGFDVLMESLGIGGRSLPKAPEPSAIGKDIN